MKTAIGKLPHEMTVEEFKLWQKQGGAFRVPGGDGRSGKYNAKQVRHEGQTYHSTAEFAFVLWLRLLKAQGIVTGWTRQVPFWIPGEPDAEKYVLDFFIWTPGGNRFVEIKGAMTATAKMKIAVVQHLYGIKIEVIKASKTYTWS